MTALGGLPLFPSFSLFVLETHTRLLSHVLCAHPSFLRPLCHPSVCVCSCISVLYGPDNLGELS